MECPFCKKEMLKGTITGDGRTKVRWCEEGKKIGFIDQLSGKGRIDAEYNFYTFKIPSFYCKHCNKMIFDTYIQ